MSDGAAGDGARIEQALERAEDRAARTGPAVDPRQFRDALGRFATGVTLITACEEGGQHPVGITVNSFASVSLDPALVLWSAARSSLRHRHFSVARHFAIHVLNEDQADLARRFTKDGAAFEGLSWHAGAQGVPLIDGVLARFECETEARYEGGDHTIIVGKVTGFTIDQAASPLLFFGGRFGRIETARG